MVPLVYVATVPLWLMLTISWTWNTYYANAGYARDLHRLMCWVPIMESVHGLLSLFNYFSCPWESVLSLVYATFWSIVTILKEPVMLLCLLLVAKGWCITRHFLHRREVCVAGSILALLYASVSVQMSLRSPLATVPMVIMYVAMLVEISWSIFNNLRILKAQLLALRSLGVDPRTTPAFTKYIMFKRLAYATALYAALELAIHWVFSGGRFEVRFGSRTSLLRLLPCGRARPPCSPTSLCMRYGPSAGALLALHCAAPDDGARRRRLHRAHIPRAAIQHPLPASAAGRRGAR